MAVIVVASARSAGVTTAALALALASPRPTLLAECDPAGGTIRAGFLNGQASPHIGLHQLAAAERQGGEQLAAAFSQQLQPLDQRGDRQLLAGLSDPLQAASLASAWPAVAQLLHLVSHAGYDVIVDAGRLAFDAGTLHPVLSPAALVHQADVVLLAVHGWLDSLAAVAPVAALLRADLAANGSGSDALGVLLVEHGPERSHRVSQALQLPVLAVLPWDPPTARHLSHGGAMPRTFTRSALMRAARSACEPIGALAQRRITRLAHRDTPRADRPQRPSGTEEATRS